MKPQATLTTLIALLLFCSVSAQDTTIIITAHPCDSTVTTTLPQKVYIAGYDTVVNEDASFTAYYNTQHYAEASGNITVITPDYDTIPPHDTTFTCTGCGTCYDTSKVITPASDLVMNGLMINVTSTNEFSTGTLAEKLHATKGYSSNAFRKGFDEFNNNFDGQVKQVKDSGLYYLPTYNAPACCSGNYFYTTSQIPAAVTRLNNHLANCDSLPDVISINNEEPNFGYWKGSAYDYLAWLNAATPVAHTYGVAVSNGGLLHNIFWYVRYVYQQEGKTDSVALINALAGIGPGTPAYAQAVIDWYKIEIPGLQASQIDYINFHWYEGYDNVAQTASKGLLSVCVNFLKRLGKPIICTEFGTGNDQQALLYSLANEIKNSGVKIRVYYVGDGPLSKVHPDWYKAWILQ